MEEQAPVVKAALGVMGFVSIVSGLVAAFLGAAAWFISQQRTGMEGLGVLTAVFVQWMVALVGGYILGGAAALQGGKAARVGLFLTIASVTLTALALIYYYGFAR